MTFNKDLFLELCKEYGVRFSKDYDTIMLEENGHIHELCDKDIERVLLPHREFIISYSDSDDVECQQIDLNIGNSRIRSGETIFWLDSLLLAA